MTTYHIALEIIFGIIISDAAAACGLLRSVVFALIFLSSRLILNTVGKSSKTNKIKPKLCTLFRVLS